jgi:N-methylhydantoinase A/oxoprolinase/acetone carboxylase beta subunit
MPTPSSVDSCPLNSPPSSARKCVAHRSIRAKVRDEWPAQANQPLDVGASFAKFRALTQEINASRVGKPYSVEEVASGFITVANEGMSRPMRSVRD